MQKSDAPSLASSTPDAVPMRSRWAGFTLVELLTVLAVIGLLAGILIPTTTAARIAAKRAKCKVQFSQWAIAMEQFRQEYGYYPPIDGGGGGRVSGEYFSGTLTGHTLDGRAVASAVHLGGNASGIRFYSINEGDLNESRSALADAFGNTDIATLYDRNGDGVIDASDGELVDVSPTDGGVALLPAAEEVNLGAGVRAGIILYSAGAGHAQSDVVLVVK
jgi:prepilin-type N-terminal cleavage/methylation domain-containing protein